MFFFSIIIPTYNSQKTISVAIDSVLNQSFNNFEILVIDGLSSDKTVEIVRSYKDDKIKIISEKDKGIYDAMNKGVGVSRGEWVFFLGSDDKFYDNSVLENCKETIFKNKDIDVVYGNVFNSTVNEIYDGEFNYPKILAKNICHQAIFLRRTVFSVIGLYNLRYKINADWDHNLKWYFSSKLRSIYINLTIAIYSGDGFSSSNFDGVFKNEKRINYLMYAKNKIPLYYRLKILHKELARCFARSNKRLFFKLVLNYPRFFLGI